MDMFFCILVFSIMPWFCKICVLKFWIQLIEPKKIGLESSLICAHFYYPYIVFHPHLENPSTDTHVPLPCAIPPLCILFTPKPRPSTNSLVKFVNTNPLGHNPNTYVQASTEFFVYMIPPAHISPIPVPH